MNAKKLFNFFTHSQNICETGVAIIKLIQQDEGKMNKIIQALALYLLLEKLMNFKAEAPRKQKLQEKEVGEIFEHNGEMWIKLSDDKVAQMWSEEERGAVH